MPKAKNFKLRLACLEQWKAQWINPKHPQTEAVDGKKSHYSEKAFSKPNRNHRSR